MSRLLVVLLVCAAYAPYAYAAVDADLITNLPGFSDPFPSKQYSGYIMVDAAKGRRLHYWLVLSENNPESDPLVMWMNGGPGCSSMDGFFYEQGPFRFRDNAAMTSANTAVPALMLNPHRWNLVANMLFVEAPAGVGFSYSNDPQDYYTNDNKTALDNFNFLQNFFAVYPELAANSFYVSGESYAGVYVPTLVEQIMLHNDAGQSHINLVGFLVGNGCTGNNVGICGGLNSAKISSDYLYGHGLYSDIIHTQIEQTCDFTSQPSPACMQLLSQMSQQVGDVNIYNIYGPCINGGTNPLTAQYRASLTHEQLALHSRTRRTPQRSYSHLLQRHSVGGPDECIDGITAGQYLNDDTVRQAIHVADKTIVPLWTICTGNIHYTGNVDSLLPLYPTLIKRYRTLIYNGNADACVPYNDNEAWTSGLGIPQQEAWRQWKVDNQIAGYVTTYALNNFTFATVLGAGHMVPEDRPVQALALFTRFLNGERL